MKISVVVPVYNVETYLCQCLDSVFEQHTENFEVICIDDGSTDKSAEILKEYSGRYSNMKVINQKNAGLSAARNAGINAAQGDYILFLDSDDWLEVNALDVLQHTINGEDLICFNGRRYFEDGAVETPDNGIDEKGLTGWEYYNKYALVSRKFHFVCVVLRLYKREFLFKNKLSFEEGLLHEDNLFTPVACYYAGRVKVIPDILYVYRIRSGSITFKRNIINLYAQLKIADKLADFFISTQGVNKSIIYREIALEYFVYIPTKNKIFGMTTKEVLKLIDLNKLRVVCIYPRHRFMYNLLMLSPLFYRVFLKIESLYKNCKGMTPLLLLKPVCHCSKSG